MKKVEDILASIKPEDVEVFSLLMERAAYVLAHHKMMSDSLIARSLGMPLMLLKSLRYLIGIRKSVYRGGNVKLSVTKECLLKYRVRDKLSSREIARLLGCSKTRVNQLCREFDIP